MYYENFTTNALYCGVVGSGWSRDNDGSGEYSGGRDQRGLPTFQATDLGEYISKIGGFQLIPVLS